MGSHLQPSVIYSFQPLCGLRCHYDIGVFGYTANHGMDRDILFFSASHLLLEFFIIASSAETAHGLVIDASV